MKKHAKDAGIGRLRFFGKIRGTDNDYYICEGEIEPDGEVEVPDG